MGGSPPPGNGNHIEAAYGVAVNRNDDIYVVGQFQSDVDFNPGPGVDMRHAVGKDIFIIKLYEDGSYGWAYTIGGAFVRDEGKAISVDGDGDVVVTGIFGDTVDFDAGSGQDLHTAVGQGDIFIMKLNTDGSFVWARTMGGIGVAGFTIFDDKGLGISTDQNESVIVTGEWGSTVDFDPTDGEDYRTAIDLDMFVTKLGPDGSYIWTQTIGGGANQSGYSVYTDRRNNVYLGGIFWALVDFDPGPGTDIRLSEGFSDAFITKLNSNGTYHWTRTITGEATQSSSGITADTNGNLVVTGQCINPTDFDPGSGMYTSFCLGGYVLKLARFIIAPAPPASVPVD